MEKNLTKAKLISYLQSEDQEISQAAFGYVIRDIIHNVHPLLQMPEVIKYSRHISFARKEEILLEISSKLQGYQEISHFIQLSYWYPNQLFLISRFLETTLDANLEAKLLEIIGDKGMICFSVFTYEPIALHTERGREEILPTNPPHVQLPLIQAVVEHLQGKAICTCDGISATPTNWVMDRILNKL